METYARPFKKGTRVKLIDDTLEGTIAGISLKPCKQRPYYVYLIKWDNGNSGMPNGDRLIKIKNGSNGKI